MAKNKKYNFTLHINEEAAKKASLTPREVKGLKEELDDLNKNHSIEINEPVEFILLKGNNREVAYVRKYSRHELSLTGVKVRLVVEFPLSLRIDEQREWIGCASEFFKPRLIVRSETKVIGKEFKVLTRKPFQELVIREGEDLSRIKEFVKENMRIRLFSDSEPRDTERFQENQRLYLWMYNRFIKLNKSKLSYAVRLENIQKDLERKKFEGKRICRSVDRIEDIINAMKKKTNH